MKKTKEILLAIVACVTVTFLATSYAASLAGVEKAQSIAPGIESVVDAGDHIIVLSAASCTPTPSPTPVEE